MSDARVDKLIRKSLPAQARRDPEPCVNENLMAAYLERSLSPEEQSALESHIADCASCQEILAVAFKLRSDEEGDFLADCSSPPKKTLFRFSVPIPAIGALLVCIAIGAVFFRWQYKTQDKTNQGAITEEPVAGFRSPMQSPVRLPAQVSRDSGESKVARADSSVPEKRARVAMAENRPASPAVQTASIPPGDGISATGVELLQKEKAESAVSTLAGAVAPPPAQESVHANAFPAAPAEMAAIPSPAKESEDSSAHPAIRDETAALLLADSLSQPMTALPSGALLGGAENNSQAISAKGEAETAIAGQSANAITPARTQGPFPRPAIYAASNRIATSLYETERPEDSLRFAIRNLSANLKKAESRKIGDRVLYKHLGYWIDEQCRKHPENPIVEIAPEDPERKAILEKYPGIRSILPAAIYWEKKNFLLR